MSKYKQGDILKSKAGKKQKILGVCGEVYFLSSDGNFDQSKIGYTERELDSFGYTLSQPARWVPTIGQRYYYYTDYGEIKDSLWSKSEVDVFRLYTGNVNKTHEESMGFLLRLQAWAGKQE